MLKSILRVGGERRQCEQSKDSPVHRNISLTRPGATFNEARWNGWLFPQDNNDMRRLLSLCILGAAVVLTSGFDDGFKRERDGKSDAAKNAVEGRTPPVLAGTELVNTKTLTWESLKGKVVVLDFWTYWCGPCKASMPHVQELYKKYKDKGLVVIGIHSDKDDVKGKAAVTEWGMTWPVVMDGAAANLKAFSCDSFPDYCLIDRKGVVRFCDLANGEVDKAVETLLNEKG
jgi:thiol-disulfide isomerase/thioredoxin